MSFSGFLGGLIASGLALLAFKKQKPAPSDREGWRTLRPGWLQHGAIAGCLFFVAVIGYFFFQGGSALPDASKQNAAALLILAVSALSAIYLLWSDYARKVAWKKRSIRIRNPLGRDALLDFSEVAAIHAKEWRSAFLVSLKDGSRFSFPMYSHGAKELAETLGYREE